MEEEYRESRLPPFIYRLDLVVLATPFRLMSDHSLECHGRWPPWMTEDSPAASSTWFILLFSFVLHPLKQFLLFSSIFITVLMSRQRYIAIRHPIEYRNSNQRINPWAPALRNLAAVMSLSAFLTSPIFIETKVIPFENGAFVDINATHFQYVSLFLCNISRISSRIKKNV